jgi:hypothetical protein
MGVASSTRRQGIPDGTEILELILRRSELLRQLGEVILADGRLRSKPAELLLVAASHHVSRVHERDALVSLCLRRDRISEDDPVSGDVELADLGVVGTRA